MDEALTRRVPPHSEEAERSVIGSMVMSGEAAMAAEEMLTGDDFYDRQLGAVFETMKALSDARKPIDLITLKEALEKQNLPEDVKNMEFMKEILASLPTSANVREYAEIVRDKATLRRLISAASEVEQDCYRQQKETQEILDDAEKTMFQVLQQRSTESYVPVKDVVYNALEAISAAARSKSHITGLETGFLDLDYKTSGFQNSDFILVAARPSMGKTAFVLNIVQYMALRKNWPCAVFSLEMSSESLMNRLLSLESHVDSQKIRTGKMNDEEWTKLVEASGVIADSKIIIDNTPGITLQELRSKARKFKIDMDIRIIFIDYLQLMAGSGKRGENRQQEISDISRGLKGLARELNIPVVALSQLNRSAETRDDHRPMLSDLRESGAIEQDADVVMFIYRDDYYNKDTEEKNIAEIIIAKQRNGPIGTTKLVWLPEYTKFANMKK
ncbi:MAG: replicative DNA helicase [Clostridiales bacterium]|jgi:replicative DNA helicase|uniref:replicative DNA helicase n=1 Tax=Chordicoccus furentiruminis TaxID=2709410 RepID=UPI0023A81253|nr:replicative DNA helicase [Chordicoccus furentiruminis]MCI6174549.1 replicative DNA helicase [Clostridiales bacterium]